MGQELIDAKAGTGNLEAGQSGECLLSPPLPPGIELELPAKAKGAGGGHVGGDGEGDPKGRWTQLTVLMAGMLMGMATWFSAAAVLPRLKDAYGIGETTGAFLTIAVQIGFVVGSFLSALFNLPDVLPVRLVFAMGACGAAAANGALLHDDLGFEGAVVSRALTGMFLAGVYPSAMKASSTWFRQGRGFAMGVLVGMLTLGSGIPFLLKALGANDHKVVLWGTSAATVFGGIFVGVLFKSGPLATKSVKFDIRVLPLILKDKSTLLGIGGYFGHMWELYGLWTWYNDFAEDLLVNVHNKGTEEDVPSGAAWLTTTLMVAGFAGCVVGGRVADKWGRTRWAALCMVISGTCSLAIGPARPHLPLVVLLTIIWGAFVVADSAQFSAIVSEVCYQDYMGTALTVQIASGFSLTILTIFLIPYLIDQGVTYRWALSILSVGPFLGVVAMVALLKSDGHLKIAGGRG
eukprot:evm.model.scf_521.4 EVM.evm.TU.scf_521.4   scf_521:29920-35441(+)